MSFPTSPTLSLSHSYFPENTSPTSTTPDEVLENLLTSTIKSLRFSFEKSPLISPRSLGIGPFEIHSHATYKSKSLADTPSSKEEAQTASESDRATLSLKETKISEIAMFYFKLYVDDFARSIKQTARSMIIIVNDSLSPESAAKYASHENPSAIKKEESLSSKAPSKVTLELCKKVSQELEEDLKTEVSFRLLTRHKELITLFRSHYSDEEIEFLHSHLSHPLAAKIESKTLHLITPHISNLMEPIKTTITNKLLSQVLATS